MVWPALIAVLGSYVDKQKKQRAAQQQAYGEMLAQSAQDQGAPTYGIQAARAQNQIDQIGGIQAGQLASALSEIAKDDERDRERDREEDESDRRRNGLSTVVNYRRRAGGGYGGHNGGGGMMA